MSSKVDLVASFSQDARQFAFQSGIAQKNTVDLYPLDPSNNYEVNSSLVERLDYENNDLKASELLFLGWCSSVSGEDEKKVKRKRGEGEEEYQKELQDRTLENVFVNGFSEGQLVIFSSNGKSIVNIIRNKQEFLNITTEKSHIWALDSDKCVKKYQYNVAKPLKTFHLTDGKDEGITGFQVMKVNNETEYLFLITEQHIHIIDPSKRRPTTVAKLDIFGAIACALSSDGKYLIVADIEKISVFEFETQKFVQSWDVQAERLEIINDLVVALGVSGKISVFKLGENDSISTVRVANSEIIEFSKVGTSIMLAWLNVNEPNFKLLSLENISGNKEIVINEEEEEEQENISEIEKDNPAGEEVKDVKVDEASKAGEKNQQKKKKKITQDEKNELTLSLKSALESNSGNEQIIKLLTSEGWDKARIIEFISKQHDSETLLSNLFSIVVTELQKTVWSDSHMLRSWCKLLITLKPVLLATQDKKFKKNLKHLRQSLKSSSDTVHILVGIQGRLEMLHQQDILRQELAKLSVGNDGMEADVIEEGEADNDEDDGDSITYVNGETDVFIDAPEYKKE
ncbi:hypothetical protein KAFR_0E04320 [Kazachstania africana CBS 2517]|uniref:Small-subunit processome Utp12 domain-containing protein n=1 Tax=Kazachstania africana (strain ATCC 22294 / BCRC 22015 / CBS 2517 / CECT 1963 / NBRC 1671 / NRRL Y-8276) TaxID=1071382 RepID=H2AW33_KAZAF|nr:hypothetical protein KAFR_0E04320 [Kazachstania africana CBS 2517]CCF58583.1 hypothetical protein KAFR_0E04320 [Kazachstania africana CBS 2517]